MALTFAWTAPQALIGAVAGAALGYAFGKSIVAGAALGYVAGAGVGGSMAPVPTPANAPAALPVTLTLQPGAMQSVTVASAGGSLTLFAPAGATIQQATLSPDVSNSGEQLNPTSNPTSVSWSFMAPVAIASPSAVAVTWTDANGATQTTTVDVNFT